MTSIVSNVLSSSPCFAFLFSLCLWPPDPVDAHPPARFCWLGPCSSTWKTHADATAMQGQIFWCPPGGPPVVPAPLSPGAPSRVWNVEVKTKVPDRYQTSRGARQHPKPPSPGDPTISKLDRSRLDSPWPASSYTPTRPQHACASARLCTSQVPLGSERGVLV